MLDAVGSNISVDTRVGEVMRYGFPLMLCLSLLRSCVSSVLMFHSRVLTVVPSAVQHSAACKRCRERKWLADRSLCLRWPEAPAPQLAMVKVNGKLMVVTWKEALEHIRDQVRACRSTSRVWLARWPCRRALKDLLNRLGSKRRVPVLFRLSVMVIVSCCNLVCFFVGSEDGMRVDPGLDRHLNTTIQKAEETDLALLVRLICPV